MSIDPTCGCCEGIGPVTPRTVYNRPGLTALSTRVGTHPDFLETMVARLTTHALPGGVRPLKRLTTRDGDDPSIALLDAWAVVADVLTFYQERIANEGYLGTATQRRSILELGRLVGYRLRPGVAASVYLAFSLEEGYEVTIPAGTLTRSLPGPGENAEPFETDLDLAARDRWSSLTARLTRPQALSAQPVFQGVRTLYLEGTTVALETGGVILLTGPAKPVGHAVRAIERDTVADRTRVDYAAMNVLHQPAVRQERPDQVTTPLSQLGSVVTALREPPSGQPASRFQLGRDPARTYAATADLAPQILAEFDPSIRNTLFEAYEKAPVTGSRPEERTGVEVMQVRATPFGATAPLDFIYLDGGEVERREWPLAEPRCSLSLEARLAQGAPGPLAAAFTQDIDLDAQQAAPIDLAIRIWDPMVANPEFTVSLSDLADADTSPDGRLQALDTKRNGVPMRIEARYSGPLDATSAFRLEHVRVIWGNTATDRPDARRITFSAASISIDGASAALPNSGLSVTIDGTANTIFAGRPPLQVEGFTDRRATLTLNADGTVLTVRRSDTGFDGTATAARILSLDAEYDGIVPGGRLLIDDPATGSQVFTVLAVRSAARSDYSLSQTVTQVLLDDRWLTGREGSLADIRGHAVWAENVPTPLAEQPILADVGGLEIELDGLYDGLEAGRWIAVTGERTDILAADGQAVAGVEATELAMIAGVAHQPARISLRNGQEIDLPGDTLHTRLTLAEPLAYTYARDTVAINANVVIASHGETITETIGSGDSAARLQTFTLTTGPLTHVTAPTPDGVETTLEVRVGGILWQEAETLLTKDGRDRAYQTRADDEDVTHITFGDGVRGARLPSGAENVSATYRAGIGAPGNVGAGQITTLGTKPLGVKEVFNPRAASGGADRESRDQARVRVPLSTQALDRLVSVEDYTSFATLYAGIDKASAARLSDGGREIVHLTLAGAGDAPIDPQSALWRNLSTSLVEFGDPAVPVILAPRAAAFLFLSAKVSVHPDYLWENVEPRLRTALLRGLGFDARALGQPVRLSEVVAAMQGVEGVGYVDVDLFEALHEAEAETPRTLADRLGEFAARPDTALPRPHIPAALARMENGALRPAELIFLNPNLPDTLILTEVTT